MGLRRLLLIISKGFVRWRPNNYLYKTTLGPLLIVFVLIGFQNIVGMCIAPGMMDHTHLPFSISRFLCGIDDWQRVVISVAAFAYLGAVLFYLLTAYLSRALLRHPYIYWFSFGLCTNLILVTEAPILINMGQFIAKVVYIRTSMKILWLVILTLGWLIKQVIDLNIISRFNVHNVHILTISAVLDTRQLLAIIKLFSLGPFLAQLYPFYDNYIYVLHSLILIFFVIQAEIFASLISNILLTFVTVYTASITVISSLVYFFSTISPGLSSAGFYAITYLSALLIALLMVLYKYSKYHDSVEHFTRSISFMRFLEGSSLMGRSSSRLYALLTTFVRNCNERDGIPIHRFEASCIQLSIETQKATTYFNTKIFLFPPGILLYLICIYYPLSLLLSFYEFVRGMTLSKDIDLVNLGTPQEEILLNKKYGIALHARGQQPPFLLEQFSIHNIRLARLCELRTYGMDTALDRYLIKLIFNCLIVRQEKIEMAILGFILLLLNDSATKADDYKELASQLHSTSFFRYIDICSVLVSSEARTITDSFFMPQHLYREHCIAMYLARKYAVPFITSTCAEFGQILAVIFTKSVSISHIRILHSAELTMALDFAWSYFASPWVFIYFGTILEIMLNYTGMTGNKRYEEQIHQKTLQFAALNSKKLTGNQSAIHQDTTTLFNFISLAGKHLSPAQYFFKTHLLSLFPKIDFKIFELESVYQEVSYPSLIYDTLFPYVPAFTAFTVKIQGQGSKIADTDSTYLQQRMPDGKDRTVIIVPYVPTLYSRFEKGTLVTIHTYSEREVFTPLFKCWSDAHLAGRSTMHSQFQLLDDSPGSATPYGHSFQLFLREQRIKYTSLENSEYTLSSPKEVSGDEVYLVDDGTDGGKLGIGTTERWSTRFAPSITYDLPPAVALSRLIKYYAYINTSIGQNTFQKFIFGKRKTKTIVDPLGNRSENSLFKLARWPNLVQIWRRKKQKKHAKKQEKVPEQPHKGHSNGYCESVVSDQTQDTSSSIILGSTKLEPIAITDSAFSSVSRSSSNLAFATTAPTPPVRGHPVPTPGNYTAEQVQRDLAGISSKDEKHSVSELLTSEKLLTQAVGELIRPEAKIVRVGGVSQDTFSIMTLVVLIDLIENIYTFEAADNNNSILTVGNTGHIFVDTLFKNNFLRFFRLLSGFIVLFKPLTRGQGETSMYHDLLGAKSHQSLTLQNWTLVTVLQLIYNEFCIVRKVLSSTTTIRHKDQSILFMYYGFLRSFNFCPKDTARFAKICREIIPEAIEADRTPHLRSFLNIVVHTHSGINVAHHDSPGMSGLYHVHSSGRNTPASQSSAGNDNSSTEIFSEGLPISQHYDPQIDNYSDIKARGYLGSLFDSHNHEEHAAAHENDIFGANLSKTYRRQLEEQIAKRADGIRAISIVGRKVHLGFISERMRTLKGWFNLPHQLDNAPHTTASFYISLAGTALFLFVLFCIIYFYLGDLWVRGLTLSDYLDLLLYKYIHNVRLWSIDKKLTSNTRGKCSAEMRKQYETVATASLSLSCFYGEGLCNGILTHLSQYSFLNGNESSSTQDYLLYNGSSNAITNDVNALENDSFYKSQLINLFPSELYNENSDDITIFLSFFTNLTTPSKTFQDLLSGIIDPSKIFSYISVMRTNPLLSKVLQIPETFHWLWEYQAQLENYIPRISITPSVLKQSKALSPIFAYTVSFREYADILSSLLYQKTYLPDNERFHIKFDDSRFTTTPLFDQNIFETAPQGVKKLILYSTVARDLAVQYLFNIELPIHILICTLCLVIVISTIRSIQFRKLIIVFFRILSIYQQLNYNDISRLSNAICFKICDFVIQFYDINALQMLLRDPHINKSSSQSRMTPFSTSISTSKLQTRASGTTMQTPATSAEPSVQEVDDVKTHGELPRIAEASTSQQNQQSFLSSSHRHCPEILSTMLDSRSQNTGDRSTTKSRFSTPLRSEDLNNESLIAETRSTSSSHRVSHFKQSRRFCCNLMAHKVLEKIKEIKKQADSTLSLTFMQRVFICCPFLGIFISFKSRLEALEKTCTRLKGELDLLSSLSTQSAEEKQIVEGAINVINARHSKMNYRYVALKRKADNIQPICLFLLLVILSVVLSVASVHVLGSISMTLTHRVMSSESALLLTRKLHFFQHMLNYLETGIWNIRMGANVSTYKETYTSAVKHLNVEELESMFSEFNRYNVFSIPLTSYARILAPCSNLFYALTFVFEPLLTAPRYLFTVLRAPLLFLTRIVAPSQLLEYTRRDGNVIHRQLDYHLEVKPFYSDSTVLTYYKLLRYFIDVSNTMLELPMIKAKDSSYDFVATNYDVENDSAECVLKKTLFSNLLYDTYSLEHYLDPRSPATLLVDYFDSPNKDAVRSFSDLYHHANKILDMTSFKSLFYLFSARFNQEVEIHLGPKNSSESVYDTMKRAMKLYLFGNFTEYILKDTSGTIRLVDLNLSTNFIMSIISLSVLLLTIIPLALYCSLYVFWSFKHLLFSNGHSHGFNSGKIRKYINILIIIGIFSAGLAGCMLVSLSGFNLAYAFRIDREYALIRSLHELSSYHLRYRRDSIATFLDQPVAYSPTDVFVPAQDRLDTIYHESLSLLYYYGFFIPHLNRQDYYNISALKEDLLNAALSGYNETSYISELQLYNSMPSYSSYILSDFPISIQEYIYAAKKLIEPNIPLIRWNENLGNARFTQGTVEEVLSSFYSFAEQRSFSILIQKHLRDNYVLALYQPTADSPDSHINILDSIAQMHLDTLDQANMGMEYAFGRLYDGIMSLFVQKQKEHDSKLEVRSLLIICSVLLTLVTISISIVFSSLPIYTVYARMLKDSPSSSSDSPQEVSAIEVEMLLEQTGHMVNSMYNMQMDEHAAKHLHRNDKVRKLFDKIASSQIVGTKQLFLGEIVFYTLVPLLIGTFGLFFLWGSIGLIFMYAKYYSISSYVKGMPMLVESVRYINQYLITEAETHPEYASKYSYSSTDNLSVEEKIAIKESAQRFQSFCDLHAEHIHLLRIMLESICYGSEYVLKFSSPSVRFGERIQGFSAEIDSTLLYWNQHESVTTGHVSCRKLYERLTELSIPALTRITHIADQISPLGINANYTINLINSTNGTNVTGSITLGQILNLLVPLSNINLTSNLETFRVMSDTLQVAMEAVSKQINTYLYNRIVTVVIVLVVVVFVYTISIIALIWSTGRLKHLKSVIMFGHNILVEWRDTKFKRRPGSSD
ncbi:hypothetical protein GL50803_0096605 [Giardia duodenalis]|uniref:Uncharacterized protein n=1 Tax=Giardia intestinalis (strain ATCC 50803 / WB clone C6) TaxID=184922 RepID=D3KHX6_GIAIC|nr:hypothetical protein GL50803_0096605 [Giardia intestinalis]KAE8304689.1 hypothetical protein GL50803_0096605 [Giardia intestinalis]